MPILIHVVHQLDLVYKRRSASGTGAMAIENNQLAPSRHAVGKSYIRPVMNMLEIPTFLFKLSFNFQIIGIGR